MLYHVSPKRGLKTIQPHISTHKKPYVYAIENMVTGLLFGVKKDDFDFIILNDENDVPIVYECYPDALKKVYQEKTCSVYILEDNGFQRGMTSWRPELVCENEVEVIDEIVVDDIYKRLLEEEQNGKIKIHRYEYCDEYRKIIANHIVDRIIRFEIDINRIADQDERFSTYYKAIIQELIKITDGHLLQ